MQRVMRSKAKCLNRAKEKHKIHIINFSFCLCSYPVYTNIIYDYIYNNLKHYQPTQIIEEQINSRHASFGIRCNMRDGNIYYLGSSQNWGVMISRTASNELWVSTKKYTRGGVH
jgi:hypothetical protein